MNKRNSNFLFPGHSVLIFRIGCHTNVRRATDSVQLTDKTMGRIRRCKGTASLEKHVVQLCIFNEYKKNKVRVLGHMSTKSPSSVLNPFII